MWIALLLSIDCEYGLVIIETIIKVESDIVDLPQYLDDFICKIVIYDFDCATCT